MTIAHRISKRVVIGLDDSSRLDGFFEQEGGSSFSHHVAYDGRVSSGDEYFDRTAFKDRAGWSPSNAEVGCAISHFQVLKDFAQAVGEDNDFILVAEDDARFSPHTERVLSKITRDSRDIDYLLLANPFDELHGWNPARRAFQLTQQSLWVTRIWATPMLSFSYGNCAGTPYGTGFYLCSRRAARRYVDYVGLGRIAWLADEYHIWANRADIDMMIAVPNLAGWTGQSSIRSESGWEEVTRTRPTSAREFLQALRIQIAPKVRLNAVRMRVEATVHHLRHGTSLLAPLHLSARSPGK